MTCKSLFFVAAILLAACASPSRKQPQNNAGYVPAFTRISKGYRPVLPYYKPEVSYRDCENCPPERFAELQRDFIQPLVADLSDYDQIIGAIVIDGCEDSSQTTFTLWLIDGRRLDSGHFNSFLYGDADDMGLRFYRRAIHMLHRAVPASKVKEARNQ